MLSSLQPSLSTSSANKVPGGDGGEGAEGDGDAAVEGDDEDEEDDGSEGDDDEGDVDAVGQGAMNDADDKTAPKSVLPGAIPVPVPPPQPGTYGSLAPYQPNVMPR